MRPAAPRYPVDRYLVESSKIEMVNIIGDEIWNPEPVLRPEEEIILRKLHDMLQSTADDLKLLTGELATHAPRAPARAPVPFDEHFNEKVHIEELVNAKFHGYKIDDRTPKLKQMQINKKPEKNVSYNNIPINAPIQNLTATKQLTKSRTRIVQIEPIQSTKQKKVSDEKKPKETVTYNEFTFHYPTAKEESFVKDLQVQTMPSINIRGELKEQKVLQLDIQPEPLNIENNLEPKHNNAVISVQHYVPPSKTPVKNIPQDWVPTHTQANTLHTKQTRKITKMVTCESSTSTNNVTSDSQYNLDIHTTKNMKASSKTSLRLDRNKKYKSTTTKTEPPKRTHLNLDEWKKKLSSVYGQPTGSKNNNIPAKSKGIGKKTSQKKSNVPPANVPRPQTKLLNNAQYIPYSQLTLGGVKVSDIEKEISNIPNKSNIPLTPILDKIITSQENSRNNSPRKTEQEDSPRILTTSDENLLREVIDIEKTVSNTLSKNTDLKLKDSKSPRVSSDSTNEDTNDPDSYIDDFEDEKSDKSGMKSTDKTSKSGSSDNNNQRENVTSPKHKTVNLNMTYCKLPSLSIKKHVDVFEFVPEIDTQDTASQIQITNKISLKQTQTSPRNDNQNIPVQPIHNDLWSSMDPSKEIEKMFKLEKGLIKKLIMDQYGDLLQDSIDKPSTSKNRTETCNVGLNVKASQKVTQTSPKHAKSVMTSPTRTKTRTTSPFSLSAPVDHQTSPMIHVTNEQDLNVEIEQEPEELGISINLFSPRFRLRLPNTSVEVLSNLEICSRPSTNVDGKQASSAEIAKPGMKNVTSSTSIDADNSSSEISSLGEVKFKLKKKLRRNRVSSSSESSSTSSSVVSVDFNSVGILPLRSEGELSSIHRPKSKNTNIPSKSDGEISFGKK